MGRLQGCAVAYAIGITNVDPIKYDLLFERFLNPDRVSLPDIDIDFDDEGRDRVLKYVIDKYGKTQVSQIITYGTMAAKSSIKDCARVMELPLADANTIAKMIPEKPGTTLDAAFDEARRAGGNEEGRRPAGAGATAGALSSKGRCATLAYTPAEYIITPDDLTKFVPMSVAKDSDMLVTPVRQQRGGKRRVAQDGLPPGYNAVHHQHRPEER